ncbi:MAG: cysteine protease StiP domain-containing protein [Chthoniobacteraceae bacterium]
MEPEFSGSYAPRDVSFLLRRLALAPTALSEREQFIQSGQRHYSEMIGPEDAPNRERVRLFRECLAANGPRHAADLVALSDALAASAPQRRLVIVSIARAGTPVGVILRRLLLTRHDWPTDAVRHYSISVIRDRGADLHALRLITARHGAESIRFVDGWTGKGTIATELHASLATAPDLAAVASGIWVPLDICGCASWAASEDDYLIPSSLLGGTISGLVSRSILPRADIGLPEFHGCVELRHLRRYDISRWFVRHLESLCAAVPAAPLKTQRTPNSARFAEAQHFITALMDEFGIADRNRVKLGIGEAVRVALRRAPDRILLREATSSDAAFITRLAALRGIPVELRHAMPFAAVALIASVLAHP